MIIKRYISFRKWGTDTEAAYNPQLGTAYSATDLFNYRLRDQGHRLSYCFKPFNDVIVGTEITFKVSFVGSTTEASKDIYWENSMKVAKIASTSITNISNGAAAEFSPVAGQLLTHTFPTTYTVTDLDVLFLCNIQRGGDASEEYGGVVNVWSIWIEYESAESQP